MLPRWAPGALLLAGSCVICNIRSSLVFPGDGRVGTSVLALVVAHALALRIRVCFQGGNSCLVPLIAFSVNYFVPMTKIAVIAQRGPERLVRSVHTRPLSAGGS